MKTALKDLRRQIIFLSFTIACFIILVMMIVLNMMMRASYGSEMSTTAELVSETAFSSSQNITSETFILSETERAPAGEYVIMRNPMNVKRVTLRGTITCEYENASWYSAGGGIIIKANTEEETEVYYYQEYAFNNDVSEIVIDFPNLERMNNATHEIPISETEISQDIFMISPAWWTSSSEESGSADKGVKLELNEVVIEYIEPVALTDYASGNIITGDYNDKFGSELPAVIGSKSSFYFITDKEERILEINSGNLFNEITQEEAQQYLSESIDKEKCTIGETTYQCRVYENDDITVRVFISSEDNESSLKRLALSSAVIGLASALVLFIMIYIISGKIVHHLFLSYEKQNQFIANASHELKTPITVISATTDILLRNSSDDKWLKTISAQSEKMQKLVNEMLELTRMNETNSNGESFESFSFSRSAEDSVLYFEGLAYEQGKQLESHIKPDIEFYGREDKIQELVNILLDNALKYSDEGGTVQIKLDNYKNGVILECSNPCSEFNGDDTEHLFERFYRGDKSHSDKKDGFGLGLSIARLIVQQHKGNITAHYDKGAITFRATFPQKKQ